MGWGSDNLFAILGVPSTTSARELRRSIEQRETMAQLGIEPNGLGQDRLTDLRRVVENLERLLSEKFQAPLIPLDMSNEELSSTFDTNPGEIAALQSHDAWVRSVNNALAEPTDASLLKEALNATVLVFKNDTIWHAFAKLTGGNEDSRTMNARANLRTSRDTLVINPILNALDPRNQSATVLKKSVSAVRSSQLPDRDKHLIADKLTVGLRDAANDCAADVGRLLERLRGPGISTPGIEESTRTLLADRCIPAFTAVSETDPKRTATTDSDAFAEKLRRVAEAHWQIEGREIIAIAALSEATKLVKSPVTRARLVELLRSYRESHHEIQAQECADAGDDLGMLAHIRLYQAYLPEDEELEEDAFPLDWETADRYLRGEFERFSPEEVDYRTQAIETEIARCLAHPRERAALEKKRLGIDASLAKAKQKRLKQEAAEQQERARKEEERLRLERELREGERKRLEEENRRAEQQRLERERILAEEQRERQRQLEELAAKRERDRIEAERRRQELRTSIRHEIGRGFGVDLIAASLLAMVLVGIVALPLIRWDRPDSNTSPTPEVAQTIPTPTPEIVFTAQEPTPTVRPTEITEVAKEPTKPPSNPTATAAASQASGLEEFDIAKQFSEPASWCSVSAQDGIGVFAVSGASHLCDWTPKSKGQPRRITLNLVNVHGSGSLYVFANNTNDGKLWIYRVNFSGGRCSWSVTYEKHVGASQVDPEEDDTEVEPHRLPASTNTSSDDCTPKPGKRPLTISLDVYSKRPSFRVNGVDVANSYTPYIPIPTINDPGELGFGIESYPGGNDFSVELHFNDLET